MTLHPLTRPEIAEGYSKNAPELFTDYSRPTPERRAQGVLVGERA